MTSIEGSLQNGGSMVVNPKGEIVSGPLVDKEGILYFDVDPLLAVKERHNLDISGHYSRFDIFNKPLIEIIFLSFIFFTSNFCMFYPSNEIHSCLCQDSV